jgi:hypothetical protein
MNEIQRSCVEIHLQKASILRCDWGFHKNCLQAHSLILIRYLYLLFHWTATPHW